MAECNDPRRFIRTLRGLKDEVDHALDRPYGVPKIMVAGQATLEQLKADLAEAIKRLDPA